jgi:hypothetical protein
VVKVYVLVVEEVRSGSMVQGGTLDRNFLKGDTRVKVDDIYLDRHEEAVRVDMVSPKVPC